MRIPGPGSTPARLGALEPVRQRGAGTCGTVDCCCERVGQTHPWEVPSGRHVNRRLEGSRAMDVMVERCAGLDVHRDDVVATVRVPGSGRRRWDQQTKTFESTLAGLDAARRVAGRSRRDAGRDGGHRRVLEDGLPGARGSLRVLAFERASLAQRPRPQDRRQGLGVDLPARSARARPPELRAAAGDTPAQGSDPPAQGAEQRARPHDPAAREGAPRRRDQALKRRVNDVLEVRAGDARSAALRSHRP